ncbi:hypothetical protein QQS21_001131 [Conoideocrella luteorostrata]|uniref:Uncharacterized protein n=1 Tax=Conoideocrella luteorostrata TaxID=1105319 RepID=A0AAJ0CXT0_9HYPO|nr:hypothetical protein QQS21_001131 [Conoideocrella luteorostrata]
MSSYNARSGNGGRWSDRRRDFSPDQQRGRAGNSKVPGQENLPQGLNEDYYRESAAALGIPTGGKEHRSHSVPPPASAVVRRPRSPFTSSSRSSSCSRPERSYSSTNRSASREDEHVSGAIRRPSGIIRSSFSQTKAGISAGIVGAVVGGLVAKQAAEAAIRQRWKQDDRSRRRSTEAMPHMASTLLGAVAGGLGANAITHKLEGARERRKNDKLAWDKRYGQEEDLPYYDTGRLQGLNYRNQRLYLRDNHDGRDYEDDVNWRYDDRQPTRRRIEDTRCYRY